MPPLPYTLTIFSKLMMTSVRFRSGTGIINAASPVHLDVTVVNVLTATLSHPQVGS